MIVCVYYPKIPTKMPILISWEYFSSNTYLITKEVEIIERFDYVTNYFIRKINSFSLKFARKLPEFGKNCRK